MYPVCVLIYLEVYCLSSLLCRYPSTEGQSNSGSNWKLPTSRSKAYPGLFPVEHPVAPWANPESMYIQSVPRAICAARAPILRNAAPIETRRCWGSRTQHSGANTHRAYRTAARLTIAPLAHSCYHSWRGSTYGLHSSRNQGIAPCALCLRKGRDSIRLCRVVYTVSHPS